MKAQGKSHKKNLNGKKYPESNGAPSKMTKTFAPNQSQSASKFLEKYQPRPIRKNQPVEQAYHETSGNRVFALGSRMRIDVKSLMESAEVRARLSKPMQAHQQE